MSKRLTRKEKIAQGKRQDPSRREDLRVERERHGLRCVLGLVVMLTGFLLYANTLGHQYALDDHGLIPENVMTKRGVDGVPWAFKTSYRNGLPGVDDALYRPLSKAMFAAEWGLAPNRPPLSHGVNVLLYGLTGFLLFSMLCQYLKGQLLLPFIAAMLFIVHPIHTEAVANIKGRDEILCFLFFVLTVMAVHRYATRGSGPFLLLGSALFFLSLLSKESAVTFLAVIPLMLFFFTDTPRSRILRTLIVLVLVAGLFLIIRRQVLGDVPNPTMAMLDNYLVAIGDVLTQKTTAVFLMGVYLKLLLFPHPLISDGSYRHFPAVVVSDWHFLLAFVACAALAAHAVVRLKAKDVVSFSILYFFITASVVSNIFFIIGTNYGERLMYTPSLGFCLAIAALLVRGFRSDEPAATVQTLAAFFRAHRRPLAVLALVVALCGFKTAIRNADWHDDLTLYTKDIRSAPDSARLHYALGQYFLKQADALDATAAGTARREALTRAIAELNKAVDLYPEFALGLGSLALTHQYLNDTANAQADFEKALKLQPEHPVIHNNFGNLLLQQGDIDGAIKHYEVAVRQGRDYADARANLGVGHASLGQRYVTAAMKEQERKDERGYQDSMAAATRSFQTAVFHLTRAIEIAPEHYNACHALGALFRYLGDERNATYYLRRAEEIKRRGSR